MTPTRRDDTDSRQRRVGLQFFACRFSAKLGTRNLL